MKFRKINFKYNNLTKYYILTLVFAIFIIFVDKYSVIKLHKMNRKLQDMQQQVDEYDEEYKKDSATLYKLKNDPKFQEEYAREHYFMKQSKEDVYFIQAEPEDSTEDTKK